MRIVRLHGERAVGRVTNLAHSGGWEAAMEVSV
jgi:hypothetical protein